MIIDYGTILMPWEQIPRRLQVPRHTYVPVNYTGPRPLHNTVVSNGSLVISSAFTRCHDRQLLLTLWERNYSRRSEYICCLRQDDGTITKSNRTQRQRFFAPAKLQVLHLACELPAIGGNFKATVVKVASTRTSETGQCPNDVKMYIPLHTPVIPRTYNIKVDQNCLDKNNRKPHIDSNEPFSLAICAKLAFNKLDPHLVIEWVEYNIKMGVSLIIVYTNNLNNVTRRVFRHYEEEGYMLVYNFDIPMKGAFKRKIGDKSLQSWNDEEVPLSDCYSRLRLFKYVAVVDFDEFIVPVKDNDFESLLERLGKSYPLGSAFTFLMQFHITEWMVEKTSKKVSNNNTSDINKSTVGASTYSQRYNGSTTIIKSNTSTNDSYMKSSVTTIHPAKDNDSEKLASLQSLYALRFREHSPSIHSNVKIIHMPGRSHLWAPWTHNISKQLKPYNSIPVMPIVASISHYRKCRPKWAIQNICFTVNRLKQDRILRFFDDELRNEIVQKKKLLLFPEMTTS